MTAGDNTHGRRQLFAMIIGILFILSMIVIPNTNNARISESSNVVSETIISSFIVQPETTSVIELNAIVEDGVINVGEYDQLVSIPDTWSSGSNLDFYYTINQGTGKIHIGITAPVTGYVSIGWGATNLMQDADIIIGGYSTTTYQQDNFGDGKGSHASDVSLGGTEDIDTCVGSDSGSVTVLECTKSLSTGDATYDVVITPGNAVNLIMAYHTTSDNPTTTHSGAGAFTDTWTAPSASVPDAPTGLSATKGNGQVSLSWTAPGNDGGAAISDYNIYRSTTSGLYTTALGNVGSVATTYVDNTATNGQLYYYVVKAVNSVGEGAQSIEASATPSTVPGVPTGLIATKGDTIVDLSWVAPVDDGGSPLTGYNIYRNATSIATVGTSPTTYQDTGLINGYNYVYTVSAINVNGEGSLSAYASAIPSTTPGTPTGLGATKGDIIVDLGWTAPSDGGSAITNYKIYRNGSLITTVGPTPTTYQDTGLINGKNYVYTVSAVNANGEGLQSASASATPSTIPGTPTGLGATKGDTTVDLSWTGPVDDGGSSITGYNIYRNGSLISTVGPTPTTYQDTGLINGKNYVYTVSAINANGEGTQSTSTSVIPSTFPGIPTGLGATKGDTIVDLSWTGPVDDGGSSITGYNIYRNGSLITTVGPTPTTYQDTGLINGKNYVYTISAINANGEGSQSASASATPSTTPGTPTGVTAVAGNSSVLLSWTAPTEDGGSIVTGYNIYRSTTTGSYGPVLVTVGAGVFSYNDTSAVNGLTYYYVIKAENANGEGTISLEVSASPVSKPSEPTNVNATYGNNQVDLTWADPTDKGGLTITQFRIYRSETSGTYGAPIATLSGSTFAYTDSSVTNGVTYYYVITAVNSEGEGPRSLEVTATPRTVPTAPTGLTATHGNTIVDLSWTATSNNGGSTLTGYNIYRGGVFLVSVSNVTTIYQDTGLINGQPYTYTVRAENSEGESADSIADIATPATVPDQPTSFVGNFDDNYVFLSWNAPGYNGGSVITGYAIYRSTTSGSYTTVLTTVVATNYNDTSAVNGVTYYYIVTAINAEGESLAATEVSGTPTGPPSIPLNLAGTVLSNNVTLTWDVPSNNGGSAITRYSVYRALISGGPYTWLANVTVLTYNDTGLTNGQSYFYVVTATNSIGDSQYSTELRMTIADVPSAPLNPVATYGNLQITLNWDVPSYTGQTALQNYSIYRSTSIGGPYTWVSNVTIGTTIYLDTGLTNGWTYYYVISATNFEGEGPNSAEVNAKPRTTPDAPTGLSATYGNNIIDLSWTAPGDDGGSVLTGYDIYRDGGFLISVAAGTTSYQDTGLTNGQPYTYTVRAVNSEGASADSNSANATPKTVPTQPQNLAVDELKSQIDLTWTVPSDNGGAAITGYYIYRSTTSGFYGTPLIGVSAGTLNYSDTTVLDGVTYYYVITASNSEGDSVVSSEISAIPGLTPSAPQNLSATYSSQSVDLVWEVPSDDGGLSIFQYRIFRSTDIGGPYTEIGTSSTISYADSGLTNGQIYYYKVTAENTKGQGTESSIINVTPITVPGAPTSLTATAGNQINDLNWVAPSEDGGNVLTGYDVYRDGSFLISVAAGATSYQDTGLTNGQPYTYTVRAVNAEGASIDSNSAISTPVTTPGAPQNLVGTYGNALVDLSWTAPTDNGGSSITNYNIYRDGSLIATVASTVFSYQNTLLTNGVTYSYTVSAVNANGESSQTSAVSITPRTTPGVPTGLSGVYGDSFVTLTWNAPIDDGGSTITGYNIYRDGVYLDTQAVGTSYTDNAVTNGVSYSYTVTVLNSEGESLESTSINVTPLIIASAPQNLTITYGNGIVDLTWDIPADNGGSTIFEYRIYRDGVYLATQTVGTSYTDSGLSNGQLYSYYITAVNSEGEGTQSSTVSETPRTLPGTPTDLYVTYGHSFVYLSWLAPSDTGGVILLGYNIYKDGIFLTFQTIGIDYTDNDVTNGISYSYTIAAVNSEGEGLLSSAISVTPAALPTAPISFSVELYDVNNAYLNWGIPIDDGGYIINQYRIYRSVDGSEFTSLANVSGLEFNDTLLFLGTEYNYKVTAVNFEGIGAFTKEINVTPKTIPTEPLLEVIEAGDSFVSISWNDPNNGGSTIFEYKVYRSTSPLGAYTDPIAVLPLTHHFYKDKAVENGLIYYYVVTGTNEIGESGFSNEISATPTSVPDAPINLVGVQESETVTLTWEAGFDGGSPIIAYNIYRNSTSNETVGLISTTYELTETDSDLVKGTTYEYIVRALNINGESLGSNKVSITIPLDTSSETSISSSTSSDDGTGTGNNNTNIILVMTGMIVIFGLASLYVRRRRG